MRKYPEMGNRYDRIVKCINCNKPAPIGAMYWAHKTKDGDTEQAVLLCERCKDKDGFR